MVVAVIIALIVVAVILFYIALDQGYAIQKYEQELFDRSFKVSKAKKGSKK